MNIAKKIAVLIIVIMSCAVYANAQDSTKTVTRTVTRIAITKEAIKKYPNRYMWGRFDKVLAEPKWDEKYTYVPIGIGGGYDTKNENPYFEASIALEAYWKKGVFNNLYVGARGRWMTRRADVPNYDGTKTISQDAPKLDAKGRKGYKSFGGHLMLGTSFFKEKPNRKDVFDKSPAYLTVYGVWGWYHKETFTHWSEDMPHFNTGWTIEYGAGLSVTGRFTKKGGEMNNLRWQISGEALWSHPNDIKENITMPTGKLAKNQMSVCISAKILFHL